MARSSYIYVITRPVLTAEDPVVAAFTVKYECLHFIEDSKDPQKATWVVKRYPDGRGWGKTIEGVLIDV